MGYYSEAGNKLANAITSPLNVAGTYLVGKAALKDAQIEANQNQILKEGESLQSQKIELENELDVSKKELNNLNKHKLIKEHKYNSIDEMFSEGIADLEDINQAKSDLDAATKAYNEGFARQKAIQQRQEVFKKTLEYFKSKAQGAFGSNWEKKVNKGGWMNNGEK